MKQDGWKIDGQLARETNETVICHGDIREIPENTMNTSTYGKF